MITEVACGIMLVSNTCDKNTYLIGLRPKNTEDGGYWEFPGGKKEANEDITSCLKREWREELNLEINVEKEIYSYIYKNYNCRFFKGKILDIQNLKINVHDKIDFVNKESLLNYKLFSGDEKILQFL